MLLNVLVVGSQHGNELLGERLFAYIQKQPTDANLFVEYVLANPRARQRGVRLVESDMNRSYRQGGHTYEQRRAQRLLRSLRREPFDLVIDAHTTTVDQAACFIVPGINQENERYLAASHISNIVVMRHPFIRQSLIGNIPKAVSLEVSEARMNEELLRRLHEDLLAFAHGKARNPRKDVFVVNELVERAALKPKAIASLRNFELSSAGFYPVLVGEDAYRQYTQYLGFKAQTRQVVNLS